MHVYDRRQLEQLRGTDPELERRFMQLMSGRSDGVNQDCVFQPPANIVLGREELVIVMELAGIRREDIQLATGEDELVIQGSRPDPVISEHERFLSLEVQTGRFERRIKLPAGLQMDLIAASYRDGFLIIRIPRTSEGEVDWQEGDEA